MAGAALNPQAKFPLDPLGRGITPLAENIRFQGLLPDGLPVAELQLQPGEGLTYGSPKPPAVNPKE